MKTLSVKQPHADLIIHGNKPIENRTWRTAYRGQILIHASSRIDRDYVLHMSHEHDFDILAESPGGCQVSAIVGVATVLDIVHVYDIDDWMDDGSLPSPCSNDAAESELNRAGQAGEIETYASGPWCWILGDRRPLKRPVLCHGKLNLWTPSQDVLKAVRRQL